MRMLKWKLRCNTDFCLPSVHSPCGSLATQSSEDNLKSKAATPKKGQKVKAAAKSKSKEAEDSDEESGSADDEADGDEGEGKGHGKGKASPSKKGSAKALFAMPTGTFRPKRR